MPTAAAMIRRADGLITQDRIRNYSLILLVLSTTVIVADVVLGSGHMLATGDVVMTDYLAHWTGGRLLLDGRAGSLYDPAVQLSLQQSVGQPRGLEWFVAPPTAALMYAPFAWLPYGWSAAAWTVASVAMLVTSVVLVRPLLVQQGRRDKVLALAFLASPPVYELVGNGQDSSVVLLVLVVALRLLMAERCVVAGAVLALGLVKPHLLVFVPVVLLTHRRYRALASLTVTSAALILLTLPVVGLRGWQDWAAALRSPRYTEAVQVGQTWRMQSISGFATALGAPPATSYILLLVGFAALLVWLRCGGDIVQRWAATMTTTLVFAPHALAYDLVLLLPVFAVRCPTSRQPALRLLAVAFVGVLWSAPLRQVVAEAAPGWSPLAWPWSALLLLGMWLLLMLPVAAGTGSSAPTRIG